MGVTLSSPDTSSVPPVLEGPPSATQPISTLPARTELCGLPTELLLEIIDRLGTIDIGCLALCNQHLFNALKARCLRHIMPGHEDLRRELLIRLAGSSADRYFCSSCVQVHCLRGSGSLHFQSRSTPIPACMLNRQHAFNFFPEPDQRQSSFRLDFAFIQWVMESHRRAYCMSDPLKQIPFTHVRVNENKTALITVEPRIVLDRLCLRIQEQVQFDIELGVPSTSDWGVQVCRHINGSNYMDELIACKRKHQGRRANCRTCHPHLYCEICAVEFELTSKWRSRPPNMHQCLTLTKWLSLGTGKTRDRIWMGHFADRNDARCPIARVVADASSVRGRFEAQDGLSLDALTEKNMRITDIQEGWADRQKRMTIDRDRAKLLSTTLAQTFLSQGYIMSIRGCRRPLGRSLESQCFMKSPALDELKTEKLVRWKKDNSLSFGEQHDVVFC